MTTKPPTLNLQLPTSEYALLADDIVEYFTARICVDPEYICVDPEYAVNRVEAMEVIDMVVERIATRGMVPLDAPWPKDNPTAPSPKPR